MYHYEVLVHVRGGGRCKESSRLFPMYVVLVVFQSTDELYLVCWYLLLFSMLYLYLVSQGYCGNYKVIFVTEYKLCTMKLCVTKENRTNSISLKVIAHELPGVDIKNIVTGGLL